MHKLMPRAICALTVMLSFSACVSAEEKERRKEEAMVAQAKIDMLAESLFVQDSLKLAASITVDTMEFSRDSLVLDIDTSEPNASNHIYRVFSRNGAICLVDSTRFSTIQKGDTLSCQWERPK